jgi:rubrerythrin
MTGRLIAGSLDDPQLAERLVSRRDALVGAGGRLGALVAAASVPLALAAVARTAFAQGLPQAVVGVLNFALTLEYLEADFYTRGLAAPGLIPSPDRPVFQQIARHEAAHVAFLQTTLGAAAAPKPGFDFTARGAFGDVFSSYATFRMLAQAFEDTGVRAYKGQVEGLMASPDVLGAALRIHSVEARHAAEVRRLRGERAWISGDDTDEVRLARFYAGEGNLFQGGIDLPAGDANTEAFDEPLTREQVLGLVLPFIIA